MPTDDQRDGASANSGTGHEPLNETMLPAAPIGLIGSTLDSRYYIETELGHGGVGVVYLARDRKLHNKAVVIKVLLEESLREPWVVQKFEQEKEALARLDHPGVVSILDSGELPDGKPYIVMQYVDGGLLRDAIKAQPEGIDLGRAASIVRQIGAALGAVHAKGILHRDLKPENIMLQKLDRGEEQVKIVDFGIAKLRESVIAPSTVTGGATAGTIIYMSPEQLRGERVTASSDIYALGVIAYEMVTGRRPYNPETIAHLAEMQRGGIRVKPADLRPRLSDEAQAVILRALSFDPKARQQKAAEFGNELATALLGEDETLQIEPEESTLIPATQLAPTVGINAPSGPPASKTMAVRFEPATGRTGDLPGYQPSEPEARRGSMGKIVGALVLLAILIGAGYFTITRWNSWFGKTKTVPVAERSLVYSLTVQKFHEGKAYDQPFETSGQEIFENGWKFQLNISSPQPGYLYLLNEGPAANGATTYNLLFPEPKTNSGAAKVDAGNKLQTALMRFDDHQGTEKFWIVWSANSVKELDDVAGVVNAQQKGEISDVNQAKAVRDFLDKHASPKPEVAKDSAKKQTIVKGKGDVLVNYVELEHH